MKNERCYEAFSCKGSFGCKVEDNNVKLSKLNFSEGFQSVNIQLPMQNSLRINMYLGPMR